MYVYMHFFQNVWPIQICFVFFSGLDTFQQLKLSPVRMKTAFMIQNFFIVIGTGKYS